MRPASAIALEALRFVLAILVALTLVFLAFQVWSGSPELSFVPRDPRYAGLAQQNVDTFALDQPVWTRYGVWLADVFLGRLGISYYFRLPVLDVLSPWLPSTLELMIATTLWAVVIGGLLGWAAAGRRVRGLASASRIAGLVLYGVPLFWVAILLVYGVSQAWQVNLGTPLPPDPTRARPTGFPVLDAFLSGDSNEAWLVFWTTALLTLPAGAALALPILLRVQNGLRRSREAQAFAGLPPGRGLPLGAAFRAALASIVGGVAAILPFVVTAAVVTEILVGRRGLGWFAIAGLDFLDAPLMQGALVLLAILAVVSVLPFALLEAAFLRRDFEAAPTKIPAESAVAAGIHAAVGRFVSRSSLIFWAGVILFAVPVLMAAFAPLLSPYGPLQTVTDTACRPGGTPYLQPPCPEHPLGTNYFGFDVFSQVLSGGILVMTQTAQALAVSTGIALGLALLCGVIGRVVDVPLRLVISSIAVLPGLVVVFLFFVSNPLAPQQGALVSALEFLFVPIVFRDARNLVRPVERPAPLVGSTGMPAAGPADRLRAAIIAVGPGLLARTPRRLAEMTLLFELFAFFGMLPTTVVDWAQITAQAISSNALIIGNWGWVVVPGLLLFVYVTGLVLISDGLRAILAAEPLRPVPTAPFLDTTPSLAANP